jgi:hypothetical protein
VRFVGCIDPWGDGLEPLTIYRANRRARRAAPLKRTTSTKNYPVYILVVVIEQYAATISVPGPTTEISRRDFGTLAHVQWTPSIGPLTPLCRDH